MNYKIIGIDLAKEVFQIGALNQANKVGFNKKVTRKKLIEVVMQLEPTLIAMEACSTSNYWSRKLQQMGHQVVLVPAQHVKAFVKGNKNDANDAIAICEAALRPNIHFVPIKSIEYQDIQMLHGIREGYKKSYIATGNQIRAYLREYGITVKRCLCHVIKDVPTILEDAENELTDLTREYLHALYEELLATRLKAQAIKVRLEQWVRQKEEGRRLMELRGFGPLVTSAFLCAIGDGSQFSKGRNASAWVGLVPGHTGTGGKVTMLGCTKNGNRFLRTLLIHGARSVVTWAKNKTDKFSQWINRLVARRGKLKTYVAVANKLVRVAWHMLRYNESLDTRRLAS